jgi:hypothetical protein
MGTKFIALIALKKLSDLALPLHSSSSAYEYPHCGTGLPYGLQIRRPGHNPPRGPSASWWVLTTANAAGTNGLTCFLKQTGARDSKFLVTHPTTDPRCLTSAIALTAGPSSSHFYLYLCTHTHDYRVQSKHL